VPKARGRGGRTSAFGQLNKPLATLRLELRNFFAEVRVKQRISSQTKFGVFPIDSLRGRLTHILELDVCYQKPGNLIRGKPGSPNKWERKSHVVKNPIWDVAPRGAYYKAKRFCSLTRMLASDCLYSPQLARDLERLSIVIWKVSKRHFDALLRRIRAEKARLLKESPEAPKHGMLIGNPLRKEREQRCTQHRACQHKAGFTAMRLSTCVDVVLQALKCTKCARCPRTRWFTPHGATAL